jgi:2-haloacid dehalogenase
MPHLRPKFITFDCYGTLTRFRMGELAREHFSDRVAAERVEQFVKDFAGYRLDEVLGPWKPYAEVLANAVQRTCARHKITYTDEDGRVFYEAVPTWGPHRDVPEPLRRLAREFPLVILSNAADEQIHSNVEKLGAPFHAVFTAQQAGSYKPRLQGFEYMLERLGCAAEDVLHVSASLRYDLMSAYDVGIRDKVYVNRGYEPSTPYYEYREISHLGGLPELVGL